MYEQILEDALKAKDLLENEVEAEYTFRPSKAAAYALLARIYLYRGEYTECWKSARKAREIMDEPSDYNDLEKYDGEDGNPDEGIEGLPYNNYEYPDIICYKEASREPNHWQNYNLSDDLMALFDKDTDLRWKLFVSTYSYYGEKKWR